MTGDDFTQHYTFHGLGLAVAGNQPRFLELLHSRLRRFSAPHEDRTDLVIEFCCVPRAAEHVVEPPGGGGRPVYDLPVGEVVYSPAEDRFSLNFADRVRGECLPREGRIRLSIVETDAENLLLAAHPLFTLAVIELLKRRGRYSLHAAGLSVGGKALLLAGSSGSGKSTLTVALLRAGFGFLGDDMLFLQPEPDGIRVLAFPDELDLTEEAAGFFPELRPLLELPELPGRPKRAIRPEGIYAVDFVRECRASVVVFPRVAHTENSVLRPLAPDAALLELAPNVLLTEARSSQAHLDALAALVRESTCYRLETGRDFEALPSLFRTLAA